MSNLNRQFLFRPEHVGRSKADVAAHAVTQLAPGVKIVPHFGNVRDARFGVPFVRGFTVVVNALDNMEVRDTHAPQLPVPLCTPPRARSRMKLRAKPPVKKARKKWPHFTRIPLSPLLFLQARRHMNRLCLAANVPLVEAGTMGYAGQAFPIRRGETPCLECTPTPPQKQFPICTIRSLPDKPVHCVVWAKELFKLLLGDSKSSTLFDGAGAATTNSAYMSAVENRPPVSVGGGAGGGEAVGAAATDAAAVHYARAVFQAVFHDDIKVRLEIAPEVYKRAPPSPLDLAACESGQCEPAATGVGAGVGAGAGAAGTRLAAQRVPTVAESASLFVTALSEYFSSSSLFPLIGSLEFNKDSASDLALVTAATNLRAATFGIPLQSSWDVKSIAGNIIPAIATTNAIAAGLEVLEVLKILRAGAAPNPDARITYITREAKGQRKRALLTALKLEPPRAGCFVCGTQSVGVRLDTGTMTLRALVRDVFIGALGFAAPNIDNGDSFNFVEDREDGESDDEYAQKLTFLDKSLAELVGGGIRDGTVLTVTDFSQDLTLMVTVSHATRAALAEAARERGFEIVGVVDAAAAQQAVRARAAAAEASEAIATATLSARRAGGTSKRLREETSDADGVICIDESNDEAEGAKRARNNQDEGGKGDDVILIE